MAWNSGLKSMEKQAMEANLNKKPEKKGVKNKTDPIEALPDHVIENILKYLSVQELLETSLTSKNWYTTIGSSLEFRKRITVTVGKMDGMNLNLTKVTKKPSKKLTHNGIAKMLSKSTRKYENLLIMDHTAANNHLWIKTRKWKNVYMNNVVFESIEQFHQFLGALEAVEDLAFKNVDVVLNIDNMNSKALDECQCCLDIIILSAPATTLHFPMLKELALEHCPVITLLPFWGHCEKLHHLTFLSEGHSGAAYGLSYVLQSRKQETITNLDLFMCSSNIFNTHDLAEMDLKLKEFGIKFCCHQTEKSNENFKKFIKKHGPLLNELMIYGLTDIQQVFEVWNELKSLSSLTLYFCNNIEPSATTNYIIRNNLKSNDKLIDLKVTSPIPFNCLQPILKKSPNLEEMTVSRLTKEIVEFAAVNMKKLKFVYYYEIEAGVNTFYDQMKIEAVEVNAEIALKKSNSCPCTSRFCKKVNKRQDL